MTTIRASALSVLLVGILVAEGCSSSDSAPAPSSCFANPWQCPSGKTCWIASLDGQASCLPADSSKSKGDVCLNIVGQPSCPEGMLCMQLQGDPQGYCSPYCSTTDPSKACAQGETCTALIFGTAATQACLAQSSADAGTDAAPQDSASEAAIPTEAATESEAPSDSATSETGYPETPGIYLTITDTAMKGTYSMTREVQCVLDGAYPKITGFSEQISTVDEEVTVSLEQTPESGGSYSSPYVSLYLAFKNGFEEMGAYPPPLTGPGTCTLEADQGWPTLRARFSCTGLVGAKSNTPFEIQQGRIVCP